MRRNRRDSLRKERIIMIASSAFVLAALTMTGLYMRGQEVKQKDDGYTLDFTALENSADKKFQEIQDKEQARVEKEIVIPENRPVEDDLDYMPAEEAGSGLVEIPGLTDRESKEENVIADEVILPRKQEPVKSQEIIPEEIAAPGDPIPLEENAAPIEEEEAPIVEREVHFSEEAGLIRPVSGEVLLPYSMNGSIYFATLAQYKYNPATMYKAEEGTAVAVCAEGRVLAVFDDAEIGRAVTLDLGNGYTATYGQLADVRVQVNDYVDAGAQLGTVSAPTKYFSTEGANLYFKLEKDGAPLDPEGLF